MAAADLIGIKEIYKKVNVSAVLTYGIQDWALESDRLETQKLLRLNRYITLDDSIHFSFLENTEDVSRIILT